MPSGPSHTAHTAAVFVTIVNTTSLRSAASRGESAHRMPASISHCAFPRVRFQPVTVWPASSRRFAMPPPITPRPTNPTSATACRLPVFGTSGPPADVPLDARHVLLHPLPRILRTLVGNRFEDQAMQLDRAFWAARDVVAGRQRPLQQPANRVHQVQD